MRDPIQPKLDFDEEFVDWAFMQLPLWLIESLWASYTAQTFKRLPGPNSITDEDIKALEEGLGRLFRR